MANRIPEDKAYWQGLYDKHGSILSISSATGMDRNTIKRRLLKHKIDIDQSHANTWTRTRFAVMEKYGISEAESHNSNWVSQSEQRANIAAKCVNAKSILVLSDLHFPFVNRAALKEAMKIEADVCVIGGDLLDLDSLSVFIGTKQTRAKDELRQSEEFIEQIKALYKTVIFITGNHEERLRKSIMKMNDADVKALLEDSQPGFGHISQMLKNKTKIEATDSCYIRIGDCAICHFDDYSSIPMRTATQVADYFTNYQDELDPLLPPVKCIVQGHTHHLGMTVYRGVLCCENGVMATPMDYVMGRKMGSGKKDRWHPGCTLIKMNRGVTDWNASNFYYFG